MKIMVIYNDTSGNNEGKDIAEKFKQAAEGKPNVEAVVLQVTNPDVEDEDVLEKAHVNEIDTLVVIGGDGTIHHAVRMFKETLDQYKIGVIPGGTVNNLARVLEIPLEAEAAFEVIFKQQTQKKDFAKVNEDVMISTMTVGILADTAANISQTEKQKYGPLAFLKRFFQLLFKKRKYAVSIQAEENSWQGKLHLMTITMTGSVGGFTAFDTTADPDDGLMHFVVIPKLDFHVFIYNIPRILKGKLHKIPGVIYFSAKQASITSLNRDKKIGTRTDGDPTDDLPVEIEVVHEGLEIFSSKR